MWLPVQKAETASPGAENGRKVQRPGTNKQANLIRVVGALGRAEAL